MHRGRAEVLLIACGSHLDVVDPRFVRREARAILAVLRHRPLDRHLHRLAGRRRDARHDAAVVDFDVGGVEHFSRQRDRFARLDAIRGRRDVDLLGDAVHEPADQPPPEHRVRRVGDRDLRVHLPEPRVLDRHGDRLAAAVALIGEDDLLLLAVVDAGQQHRSARLRLADRVDARDRRHLVPLRARRFFVAGDLRDGKRRARARRLRLYLREILRVRVLDDDRQHVADRCAAPAALGKRPAAAEHQQPAAALVDEVGNHAELLGRERRRFHAAENQAAVLEQLFARLREAADQLVGRGDRLAVVLVLGRPVERHDLQILVAFDAEAQELVFESRLALVIENFLRAIVDLDEHVARVVLRDLFTGLRRHFELERARARFVGGEAHLDGRRFAVRRQRHLLRAHNPPIVFDAERDCLAAVAGLRQHHVDDERRALEDAARRLDARHLHVVREAFLADAHSEHRNRSRLQARERLVDRGVRRVRAVGHHYEAGERQAGKLVARAVERSRQSSGGAAEREIRRGRDAIGRGREAKEADDKPLRQRIEQRGMWSGQLLLDEHAARLAVEVGDRHAA